jgi:tetratricopeptide (TPR) repeat protein
MRAALERSLVADAAVALQLANQLGSFWLWDMHLVEGRSWLEAALAAVPERTHLRADALLGLCAILGRAGETGEHARRATEALEITEELGDAAASANALQLLGISHWASDQLDEAVEDFSAAVESGRRGFPAGHAAALHALAATMWTRGDRVRARDLVEQALDATASLPESSPSLPPPIDIAFEIARTDRWTGRLELVMEENATHFRRMTRDAALSYLLGTRGTMARVEGDLEAAWHDFDEALRAFRDHGDRRGEGAIEVRLGTLARDRGDATASREHLTRSLDIRRDLGDVRGVGVSEAVLGDLEISVGNLEVADRLLASCLDAARRRADPWTIRAALGNLASLALARGDAATATGLLEECLAVSRRTGRLRHTAWSQLRLAAVGRASGVDRAADVRAAAQAFELLGDAAGAAEAQALLDDPRPA